eukprot:1885386-Amphidinium_carterae.1
MMCTVVAKISSLSGSYCQLAHQTQDQTQGVAAQYWCDDHEADQLAQETMGLWDVKKWGIADALLNFWGLVVPSLDKLSQTGFGFVESTPAETQEVVITNLHQESVSWGCTL